MQLLLLLSALLTGLTGLIGERVLEARQIERSAIAAAAETAAVAVAGASELAVSVPAPALFVALVTQPRLPLAQKALSSAAPVDERRLE